MEKCGPNPDIYYAGLQVASGENIGLYIGVIYFNIGLLWGKGQYGAFESTYNRYVACVGLVIMQ